MEGGRARRLGPGWRGGAGWLAARRRAMRTCNATAACAAMPLRCPTTRACTAQRGVGSPQRGVQHGVRQAEQEGGQRKAPALQEERRFGTGSAQLGSAAVACFGAHARPPGRFEMHLARRGARGAATTACAGAQQGRRPRPNRSPGRSAFRAASRTPAGAASAGASPRCRRSGRGQVERVGGVGRGKREEAFVGQARNFARLRSTCHMPQQPQQHDQANKCNHHKKRI